MMKRTGLFLLAGVMAVLFLFAGCGTNSQTPDSFQDGSSAPMASSAQPENSKENSSSQAEDKTESEENTEMKMKVQVGNRTFMATLEDNSAAIAFVEMMKEAPVEIEMSDYAGFEKVGSLGTSLPTSNSQTTTHEGDIVLYNGNQIVIFYGSNSWSYTRLGKIDNLSGWKEALGSGNVTVTFSVE